MLEYLESSGLTVFYGHAGGLEGPAIVLWDVEHQPDYRKFLETARTVGAQLIVFASREFDASDLDDLAAHLDEMGLSRDERREYLLRFACAHDSGLAHRLPGIAPCSTRDN